MPSDHEVLVHILHVNIELLFSISQLNNKYLARPDQLRRDYVVVSAKPFADGRYSYHTQRLHSGAGSLSVPSAALLLYRASPCRHTHTHK